MRSSLPHTVTLPPACPPVSEALLTHLDAIYPDRCARPTMTDREVWLEAGARLVVAHLRFEYERQNKGGALPKVL